MKATIDRAGYLVIWVETELEGYALNKWGEENYAPTNSEFPKFIVHTDPKQPLNDDENFKPESGEIRNCTFK